MTIVWEEEVKEAIKEEAKMMRALSVKRLRVIKVEEKAVAIIDKAARSTAASTISNQKDWELLSQLCWNRLKFLRLLWRNDLPCKL